MAMRRWPRDEVAHREARALGIVRADEVELHARRSRGRTAPRGCGRPLRCATSAAVVPPAAHRIMPSGPILLQRAQHALLPLEAFAVGAEQDACGPPRSRHPRWRQQLGEIRVGDVVEAHRDHVGAGRAQARGAAVVDVAEIAGETPARAAWFRRATTGLSRRASETVAVETSSFVGDDLKGHAAALGALGPRRSPDRHAFQAFRCRLRARMLAARRTRPSYFAQQRPPCSGRFNRVQAELGVTQLVSTGTTNERIGFIGVGLMGHGMAKNIVEKGYPLTVMGHRNRAPVEDLLGRGASEAKIADATWPQALDHRLPLRHRLARGRGHRARPGRPEGRAEARLDRRRLLDVRSELDPGARRRARRRSASTMVDAPLSRTPKEAWEGTLDTMVGATDGDLRAPEAGARHLGRARHPYRRHRPTATA